MGPWSKGGIRIGNSERYKWSLVTEIKNAHERTIYAVDWAKGGRSAQEGGLGRMVSCGGDGVINIHQMVNRFAFAVILATYSLVRMAEQIIDNARSTVVRTDQHGRLSARRIGRQSRRLVQDLAAQGCAHSARSGRGRAGSGRDGRRDGRSALERLREFIR